MGRYRPIREDIPLLRPTLARGRDKSVNLLDPGGALIHVFTYIECRDITESDRRNFL